MKCEYCGAEENLVTKLTKVGDYEICFDCKAKLEREVIDELIETRISCNLFINKLIESKLLTSERAEKLL